MHSLVFALTSLVCVAHGRRVQKAVGQGRVHPSEEQQHVQSLRSERQPQSHGRARSLLSSCHALANLFLALDPTAAWQRSAVGPEGVRFRSVQRSFLYGSPRLSQPAASALPSTVAPLASLATLTSTIVVHELGHFAAARAQGINVSEFSVGVGPALLQRQADNGINYSLRAAPLGGYVTFPRALNRTDLEERGVLEKGKLPDDPELRAALAVKDTEDLLENRPLLQQAFVASAGVIANFFLAWLLTFTAAETVGVPMTAYQPVYVENTIPSSLAEAAGFKSGDQLLSVGDVKLDLPDGSRAPRGEREISMREATQGISAAISKNTAFESVVLRDGQPKTLTVELFPDAPQQQLGVYLRSPNENVGREKVSPTKAAEYSTKTVTRTSEAIVNTIGSTVSSALDPTESKPDSGEMRMAGPLTILKSGMNIASSEAPLLLEFGAVISINLAVINALPIPGLDGWTLGLIAVQGALRRQIPETAKQKALGVGAILIAISFVRTIFSDIAFATGIDSGELALGVGFVAVPVLLGALANDIYEGYKEKADTTATSGRRAKKKSKTANNRFPTWLGRPKETSVQSNTEGGDPFKMAYDKIATLFATPEKASRPVKRRGNARVQQRSRTTTRKSKTKVPAKRQWPW